MDCLRREVRQPLEARTNKTETKTSRTKNPRSVCFCLDMTRPLPMVSKSSCQSVGCWHVNSLTDIVIRCRGYWAPCSRTFRSEKKVLTFCLNSLARKSSPDCTCRWIPSRRTRRRLSVPSRHRCEIFAPMRCVPEPMLWKLERSS